MQKGLSVSLNPFLFLSVSVKSYAFVSAEAKTKNKMRGVMTFELRLSQVAIARARGLVLKRLNESIEFKHSNRLHPKEGFSKRQNKTLKRHNRGGCPFFLSLTYCSTRPLIQTPLFDSLKS